MTVGDIVRIKVGRFEGMVGKICDKHSTKDFYSVVIFKSNKQGRVRMHIVHLEGKELEESERPREKV